MTAPSNSQRARTLQEAVTTLTPADVVAAAKTFFARRNGIYTAFIEKEGPGYATFRGQGGEEIVIGTSRGEAGTRVSGSTYLFDQQIARFLSSLPRTESRVGAEAVAVESGAEAVAVELGAEAVAVESGAEAVAVESTV